MFCLQGVPDVPREPPDEAGLMRTFSEWSPIPSSPWQLEWKIGQKYQKGLESSNQGAGNTATPVTEESG